MRLSSAWTKNNYREIKHTWERYIAIVAIIALGVGFFSGLKITKTAMVKSLDDYVNEFHMYDFRLISTLGLTKEDVACFNEQGNVTAEGQIAMDFIADIDSDLYEEDKRVILKAHSITNAVNNIDVLYGRMPEANNELVLDASPFSNDIIGARIHISQANDEDTLEAFKYNEYTVVGIANSVNYLNYDRGTTNLETGSVYGFVYLPENGFSLDYYTEIMLGLDSEGEIYSTEYEDFIAHKEESVKKVLDERVNIRYQDIVGEANEALVEAEKEYNDGYNEYLDKKAEAEAELEEAWVKLEEAKKEISENEDRLKDGEIKLAEGEEEYRKGLKEYEDRLKEYEDEKASTLALLKSNQEELNNNRQTIELAMAQIEESGLLNQYPQLRESIIQLELGLSMLDDTSSPEYLALKARLDQTRAAVEEIEKTGVIDQYEILKSSLSKLEASQVDLDKGKEEALSKFAQADREFKEAKDKLDSSYDEIERNKLEIEDGWTALEEGRIEYENGLLEYEDGKKEIKESFLKAEEDLAEGKALIEEAKNKIKDIPEPKAYVLNRNHNMGYVNFDNDSSIVEGVAEILPIFFFLVAALVCSTTMTRMVDEQRTQIGTLKALGYSNRAITSKYMFYSASAALTGCLAGFFLGTKFFPMAIMKAYSILYNVSSIKYIFDLRLAIISLLVSLLCSAGVTYSSCRSELLQMPASLIRPKAPKAGRRVLLERIPLIWRRVSFLYKVSIRNILRYKRRFFMTITGVAGCTALIVAAMGIRDSVKNVANDQFDYIMVYDYEISFSEEQSLEDRDKFIKHHSGLLSECVFVTTDDIELEWKGINKKASLVATDDPNITNVVGLHLDGESVPYPDYMKAVINNRLAEELDIGVGDTIDIRINPTEMANIEVGGVFENHMHDYLFMTGESYRELFGEDPGYKSAYAITGNEDIYSVSALLKADESVANISVVNDIRVMVDNMMQSLDSVIWLVIICAGALGFVVIYNLNNINITERIREIATLKVLGFYQDETGAYVFRETIALTFIGGILGLVMGKLLHIFIMNEIKVEMVSFKQQIFGLSYLISFLATFIVTFLVNWMLRKKIERINMAESLKSVE